MGSKYPWPMDKPIEEIESEVGVVMKAIPPRWELVDYLLDRLKIAEAERDELRRFSAELFMKCQRLSEKI